jgi:hypothetical protein
VEFEVTAEDIADSQPWSYRGNALIVALWRRFPDASEIFETPHQSIIVLGPDRRRREFRINGSVRDWLMFHGIDKGAPFRGEIRNGTVRMRCGS